MEVSNPEMYEEIESHVVRLITRLQKEECHLDNFIKNCLVKALEVYGSKIEFVNNDKIWKIKESIERATCNLNNSHSADQNQSQTVCNVGKQLKEIKKSLFEIEDYVNTGNNVETIGGILLEHVSSSFSNLQNSKELSKSEIDRIYILILKLYLNSPITSVSNILDKNIPDLERIINELDTLKSKIFNSFDVKELESILEKYVKYGNKLIIQSNEVLQHVKIHLVSTQNTSDQGFSTTLSPLPSNQDNPSLLEKVEESEKRYRVLKNSPPLIEESEITTLRKKGNKHPCLKRIEEKIAAAALESDTSFCDKKNSLELLKREVNDVDTYNDESSNLQKMVLINRLTAFIIIESTNHLRHVKKTLDTYKVYAERFPFSSKSVFFHNKVEEINSLIATITDLPRKNSCISQRINLIDQYVDEVKVTLKQKAEYNTIVIAGLKNLEIIEKDLLRMNFTAETFYLNKLNELNEMRKRIISIDIFHERIILRKKDIWSKIQEIERKIYDAEFSEELRQIKWVLNDYEIEVESFTDLHDSDMTKKKIFDLLERVHNNTEHKQILENTIKIVLENSTKISRAMNQKRQVKDEMERNVEYFKQQIKSFDSIELWKNFDELSNLKKNIQTRIDIEKANLQFQNFKEELKQIQNNINKSTHLFKEELFEKILNDLLSMKDSIDDMPESDARLNSFKQQFLSEIYKALTTLDADVGNAAKKQERSNNIVHFQNRFTKFNVDDLKFPTNSTEFVQNIRRKAESFEECAKYYMGSSYSVDYYIVHENLLRLLEELDRVKCDDDDLLEETVDAMSYIKNLLEVLKVTLEMSL